MSTNHFVQITYKFIYPSITLSLLLASSPMLYAQQVPCNPDCSDISGGYINEYNRDGVLTVNNVQLNGVTPSNASMPNVTIAFGSLGQFPNLKSFELNATKLTINTQTNANQYARAIHLSSFADDTIQAANIRDSSIIFKSTSSPNKNTIGILAESYKTGLTYNISLANTDMQISSEATNNNVYGIFTSANDIKESNLQLDNTTISVTSDLAAAYGINLASKLNGQLSTNKIYDLSPNSITVKGNTAAYGINIATLGQIL